MAAVAESIDDITDPASSKSLHLPKIVHSGRCQESAKSSLLAKVCVDCVSFGDVCFVTTLSIFRNTLFIYISILEGNVITFYLVCLPACVFVCLCVSPWSPLRQLLRYADKRIVNIMNMYIKKEQYVS